MKFKSFFLSIVKIFNRFIVSLLVLTFILVVGLLIKPLPLPILEKYFRETIINLPGDFDYRSKGIYLGVHRFQLVLKFPQLEVTRKSKVIFKAQEMKLGIDFFESLILKRIVPNCLIVQGSDFDYQLEDQLEKQFWAQKESKEHPLLNTLLTKGELEVKKVNIIIRQPDGTNLAFKNLSGRLKNDLWDHELSLEGEGTFQNNKVFVEVGLILIGDLIHLKLERCFGNVHLKNGTLDFTGKGFNPKKSNAFSLFSIAQGTVKLSSNRVQINNSFFKTPLTVNHFKTIVTWSLPKRTFNFDKLEFKDHFLTLLGGGKIVFDELQQPIVDWNVNFNLKRLEQAYRYYPRAIMGPMLLSWLDAAFKKGEILEGNMILKGNLNDFPFDHKEGLFKIKTVVNKVDLLYQDGWPMLTNLKARLTFNKRALEIVALEGKIFGETIKEKELTATISDLQAALLKIQGRLETDSKLGVNFIRRSPLKTTLGAYFKNLSLKGPVHLKIGLQIPLAEQLVDQVTHVQGNLIFKENEIVLRNTPLKMNNFSGELDFSEEALSSETLNGTITDFPANLLISTLSDGKMKIDLRSLGNVALLEKYFKLKLPFLAGNFDYNLSVLVPKVGLPTLRLESNLRGLGCNLPVPLRKANDEITPLQVSLIAQEQEDRYRLALTWNDLVEARFDLINTANGVQIQEGKLCYGKSTDLKLDGKLIFKGVVDQVDLELWDRYFETNVNQPKSSKNFDLHLFFDNCLLKVGQIRFKQLTLTDVLVGIETRRNGYQFTVTSQELKGSVFFPKDYTGTIKGDLFYWRDLLNINQRRQTSVSNAVSFSGSMFRWDKFDLSLEEFVQGAYRMNNLFLKGEKEKEDLVLQRFALQYEGIQIEGKGKWRDSNTWSFNGQAHIDDLGKTLNKFTAHCYGGKGQIGFNVAKLKKDKNGDNKLTGDISIRLRKGGIINLSKQLEEKLNLGKIINALDVGALTKNVGLDFQHYHNGYWYDSLEGEILLDDQNLYLNTFKSTSNPADITIKGVFNWRSLQLDLFLSIFPKLTGSVPVVAGVAGGPVVGAIALVANQVVNKMVGAVLEYRYRISGDLKHFNVNKL